MTTSRVGTLKIRLRIPGALEARAAELERNVKQDLITRVLDELERLIHAELGTDVIVRIRRIALSWQLDAAELALPGTVARLARDLSRGVLDELARASQRERLRPRPETIAAFTDQAHASATLLADTADGLPVHWVHSGALATDVWETTRAAGPEALAAVVRWLVRIERLEGAVSLASPAVLAALTESVPEAVSTIALVRARREHAIAVRGSDAHESLGRTVASPPDHMRIAAPSTAEQVRANTVPAVTANEEPSRTQDDALTAATGDAAPTAGPEEVWVTTRSAGLFYLMGRVLEIELAERVWAAGLPEGDVLGHVAATLLGDLEDPSWRWFGGTFDRRPALPAVPVWAVAEICDGVQLALGQRLVRFGVALTPAGLSTKLDHLASALSPPYPLEPQLARVVTRGAAAIAYITCARLGVEPSISAVRVVCARPGSLVSIPGELRVVIGMQHFDLEHRRAGLDQDPGYLPWLRRRVRIELVGATEL